MNNVISKINVLYEKMGLAEKKIADYVLENPTNIASYSISELAEKSGSSEATVVRFSKKLGLEGYQELKIALALQGNSYFQEKEDISVNDTPLIVFNKVCDDIYSSLEKTKQVLNNPSLQSACEKIISAKRILIFGLGNSAPVAADMTHKLLRIGLNVVTYHDNHLQAIASAHVDKDCLVIAFSHSGSSKDIIEAIKIARNNGCPVISITNKSKSPIYKVSDIVINTDSEESNYNILGLSSRIAQLAIVDAIYYYTACHLDNCEQLIEKTLTSLTSKKF